jgi:hypothetical protein
METISSKYTDNHPPPCHEEMQSRSSTPSPLSPPGCRGTNKLISRHILASHALCLLFGIPSLVLFAIDLHAYSSQPHPATSSTTHPTRHFNSNPITIIDGIALTALSITILHSATYLTSLRKNGELLTPATIFQRSILYCITDWALGVTVFSVSTTAISMRAYTSNCQNFLYLDEGACDGYRRSILKAAGSMGILTG